MDPFQRLLLQKRLWNFMLFLVFFNGKSIEINIIKTGTHIGLPFNEFKSMQKAMYNYLHICRGHLTWKRKKPVFYDHWNKMFADDEVSILLLGLQVDRQTLVCWVGRWIKSPTSMLGDSLKSTKVTQKLIFWNIANIQHIQVLYKNVEKREFIH